MQPHEASIHVPLYVRWPGHIEPGSREDGLVTAVDFYPTLCGLCDVEVPAGLEGMDLSAAWRGDPDATRRQDTLLMNFGRHTDYFVDGWEWRGVRAGTRTRDGSVVEPNSTTTTTTRSR